MTYRCLIPALAASLLAASLVAQASATLTNPPQRSAPHIDPQPSASLAKDLQKRPIHATRRYKLTDAQRSQVRSILLKEQQDRATASADPYMAKKDKREELAGLFESSQQEIGAILNQQQKRKFDNDEKRRAWMDGRLSNPNPAPPW